jgi:hypothetical protein
MPSFFDTNGLPLPNHSRGDYRGGKKFQQRTRDLNLARFRWWQLSPLNFVNSGHADVHHPGCRTPCSIVILRDGDRPSVLCPKKTGGAFLPIPC